MSDHEERPFGRFPTTEWSVVYRAGSNPPDPAALEQWLARYLPVLRQQLLLKGRIAPSNIDDVLHSFVLDKVIQQKLLQRVNHEHGRFRTYLLSVLDNYVLNIWRFEQAQKRSPDGNITDIHQVVVEDPLATDPSRMIELIWARQVIQNAVERMKQTCENNGRLDLWEIFHQRIFMPAFEQRPAIAYEAIVQRFHLQSPREAYNLVLTAKRYFSRVLLDEIGTYASSEQDIQQELEELKAILSL